MGCGVSKLDPTQDDIPERIKPILQRRLEEIRSKKNNKNSDALSKKELLDEATDSLESNNKEHEQNQEENVANNKLDPTFNVTQDSPPTLQKINDEVTPLDEEQPVGQCLTDRTDDIRFLLKRHVSDGSLNIVEEEIDLDDFNHADLGHASPSFRVYCTDFPVGNDDLIVDEHASDEDTMEDQSSRHSIGEESTCSNEVSVRHIPSKKSRRGRKFKITMPKGGKIYKNMQSFYYFPCSSQTNSNLLQKAAA